MDDKLHALAEINTNEILPPDNGYFSLGDSKKYLEKIVQGAKDIIEHPAFWEELPRPTVRTLHNETETILKVIKAITDNKTNPQWLSSQLDGHIESITNLYNTVYPWFVTAIREYINSHDTQKSETSKLLKELKNATKTANDVSQLATEASSTISTVELSKFFDEIANGDQKDIRLAKKAHKRIWRYTVPSYSTDARRWLIGLLIAMVTTGIVAFLAFNKVFDDSKTLTLEEVIARGLILTAPAYAIKFCSKRYSVSKQLQITNTHRAVVMKTLLAFLQKDISNEVRENLITEAARQVFKPTDTDNQNDNDSVIEIPVPWKKS